MATRHRPSTTVGTTRNTLTRLARAAPGGILDIEHAAAALRLPRRNTSLLLADLTRRGWLSRVRRGLYQVLALEAQGDKPALPEDPWLIASMIYKPCYVGGWSAAEHWELTEQVFRSTFVATAGHARCSKERVAGLDFRVVRVSRDRLRGAIPVWRGRTRVDVSDRERTIADGLANPEWLGGGRNVASALSRLHETRHWNARRMLAALETLDRGGAYKRCGFLLEVLALGEDELVERCMERRSKGVIPLDPAVASKGRLEKRWGLWINLNLRDAKTVD